MVNAMPRFVGHDDDSGGGDDDISLSDTEVRLMEGRDGGGHDAGEVSVSWDAKRSAKEGPPALIPQSARGRGGGGGGAGGEEGVLLVEGSGVVQEAEERNQFCLRAGLALFVVIFGAAASCNTLNHLCGLKL